MPGGQQLGQRRGLQLFPGPRRAGSLGIGTLGGVERVGARLLTTAGLGVPLCEPSQGLRHRLAPLRLALEALRGVLQPRSVFGLGELDQAIAESTGLPEAIFGKGLGVQPIESGPHGRREPGHVAFLEHVVGEERETRFRLASRALGLGQVGHRGSL